MKWCFLHPYPIDAKYYFNSLTLLLDLPNQLLAIRCMIDVFFMRRVSNFCFRSSNDVGVFFEWHIYEGSFVV